MGKLLDQLFLVKYNNFFNTSDMQYGFKKRHGTTQCTFVVNEVVQYYINNNSDVHVTLLDASEAFDRVNYVKLFRILNKKRLCPVIIRFFIILYTNQSIRIQWGSTVTDLCTISNGVKQGGVLSPILFTIYVDELLTRLRDGHLGHHIGSLFSRALEYAADVVILAPTLYSLMAMLDICSQFAESYDVKFNSTKGKLVYFGDPLKFLLLFHGRHD